MMKVLIFDFGNVVAFFDHRKACRELAALSENSLEESAVYRAVFATSLECDFDCGQISSQEFIERLRITLDLKSSDDAIVKAWCDIFWPNDAVISLLPRLKRSGVRVLLASNTNELHFQWILRQFAEPLTCFDDFVLSYRVGSRKPALPFFRKCMESAGVPPEDCVYIDDRPEFVEIAREVGMTGFVYSADVNLFHTLSAEGIEVA
jgi:putative hydrolase of the HAD superfamily